MLSKGYNELHVDHKLYFLISRKFYFEGAKESSIDKRCRWLSRGRSQVIRLYTGRIFELLISSAYLTQWQQIVSLFFSYPVSVGIPGLCPFAMDFAANFHQAAVRKTWRKPPIYLRMMLGIPWLSATASSCSMQVFRPISYFLCMKTHMATIPLSLHS